MIVKCVGQHTLPERGNFPLTLGYHQGEVSNGACCLRGGRVDHCGQGSKGLFQFGNIENVIQFEMIGCYLGSGHHLQELTRDTAPGNNCGDVLALVDRSLSLRCGLAQNIYIWGVPIRHTYPPLWAIGACDRLPGCIMEGDPSTLCIKIVLVCWGLCNIVHG